MNEKDIKQILTNEYDFAQWSRIIDFTFPDVSFEKSIVPVEDNSGKTKYIHQKGDITLTDGKRIIILEAKVKKEFSISKSRVGFHNLTLKFIDRQIITVSLYMIVKAISPLLVRYICCGCWENTFSETVNRRINITKFIFIFCI